MSNSPGLIVQEFEPRQNVSQPNPEDEMQEFVS
jgi:hypothetical protein